MGARTGHAIDQRRDRGPVIMRAPPNRFFDTLGAGTFICVLAAALFQWCRLR
jgi:hypothetical protein